MKGCGDRVGVEDEEMKDRLIMLHTECFDNANAVELDSGVVVFDVCGRCRDCFGKKRFRGVAAKENGVVRSASPEEAERQTAALIGPWYVREWSRK